MIITSLRGKRSPGLLFVQCMILLMIVCICGVHGLSYWIAVKYWLFQIGGIFLPGFAVCLLLKQDFETALPMFTLSYAWGTILLVIEYFLLMPIGLHEYSMQMSVILGIFSFCICYKKYKNVTWKQDYKDWGVCALFLLLVFIIDFFVVSCVNSMPNETGGTGYYVDWLFWAGNNISFTKGFPVQNYRLVGEVFNYHYFSSIIIAQTNLITGIDLRILTFYLSPVLPAILLVFSGYVFFASLLGKRKFRIAAMILLFFTNGTTVTFADHIYVCPFGFDYGLSYGMLAITMLIHMVKEETFSWKEVLLSALLIAMATGCKGPIAMVVLMGFGVTAFVLLMGRRWKKGIAYGLVWLFSFAMVYFFFISSGNMNVSTERTQMFVGIKNAFYQSSEMQDIFRSLTERFDLPDRLFILPTLGLYIYRANKAALILLLIAVVSCVVKWIRKKADFVLPCLVAICMWGIFLVLSVIQSGSSQMYFLMATIPFAILAGLYVIEKMQGEHRKIQGVLLVIVALTAGTGMNTWGGVIIPKMKEGILCINQTLNREFYGKYYVSAQDFETYEWLKKNAEPDAILAVDYFYDKNEQPQEMVAGVFSERFVWNDGKYARKEEVSKRRETVEKFMAGDKKALWVMKEEGVMYFIQTLSVNPNFKIDQDIAECVFENQSFRIYQFHNLKNA